MAENVRAGNDEVVLVWQHGEQAGSVEFVVTSSQAEELLALLAEEDVRAKCEPWVARGPEPEVLTTVIAVAKDPAAWAAIGLAVRKFFDRHKGKRIRLDETGLAQAENYSAEDIERIVRALSAVEKGDTDA